jgi:hypothetical protein
MNSFEGKIKVTVDGKHVRTCEDRGYVPYIKKRRQQPSKKNVQVMYRHRYPRSFYKLKHEPLRDFQKLKVSNVNDLKGG